MTRAGSLLLPALLLALAAPHPGGAREDMGAGGLEIPPQEEIVQRWRGRLDGEHFTARIRLEVDRPGMEEEREVQVWRDDDEESHQERVMVRFESPPEMRGLALLYVEQQDRPNDYFVYQPELRRVRRIGDRVARADVYGVDLEYLGFGVAQIEPTEITEVEADRLDGRRVLRVEERALRSNQRFERRIVWLDPETWLPLRTQHVRGGDVVLEARTDEIEVVHGVHTPMRATFERPEASETVELHVEEIDYRSPIPRSHFTALALIK